MREDRKEAGGLREQGLMCLDLDIRPGSKHIRHYVGLGFKGAQVHASGACCSDRIMSERRSTVVGDFFSSAFLVR